MSGKCIGESFEEGGIYTWCWQWNIKKEIRNKLATEYPEITVYDAAIAKYGVGATEITISQKLYNNNVYFCFTNLNLNLIEKRT